jgi:hypothetical protein
MAAPAHLLSAVVFLILLLRHTLSWALALYPGQSWLWQLSLAFGYDFLPVLSLLRDGLNLGFIGTFAALAALAMASYAQNLFVALLVLHLAAFASGYCCLIAIFRHADTVEVSAQLLRMAGISAAPSPLLALSLGLLAACLHGHWRYIKRLREREIFPEPRATEHGIVGARK